MGRYKLLPVCLMLMANHAIASDYGTEALGPAFQGIARSIDIARATNAGDLKTLTAVRDQLTKLEDHLNKAKVGLPDEYKDVISGYSEVLGQKGASKEDLENLLADISAKNQYFERTAGFWPFDKSLLVVVKVSTFRSDKPEPGYTVAFTPRVDAQRPMARFPFSSDTNSASRRLPPGNYMMFLSRQGNRVLSKDISVGSSGTDEEEVRVTLGDGQ